MHGKRLLPPVEAAIPGDCAAAGNGCIAGLPAYACSAVDIVEQSVCARRSLRFSGKSGRLPGAPQSPRIACRSACFYSRASNFQPISCEAH